MGLIKCKECSHKVSTKAGNCPNCGAPVKKPSGCGCSSILSSVFILFVIIIFISILSETPTNISKPKWGVIRYVHTPTNIRSSRSSKSKIVGGLKTNEKVKVDFLKGNWYAVFKSNEAVRDTSKALGYVYVPLLKPKPLKEKSTSAKKKEETREEYLNSPKPPVNTENTIVGNRKWYKGGTLHKKGALYWQNASYANKLATCADFISKSVIDNKFKENLQRKLSTQQATQSYLASIRPYAEELVDFIDAATEKDIDPIKNQKLFANQKVAEIAVLGMIMMNWTK